MNFNVTHDIINNSTLLIVGVEDKYTTMIYILNIVKNRSLSPLDVAKEIQKKFNVIVNNVWFQQFNHVYLICKSRPYRKIEELSKILPYWDKDNEQVHAEIISTLTNHETVLVCGIWKERCVFELTRRLIENGINAILLDNEMSISSSLIGDDVGIDRLCRDKHLNLVEV